MDVPFKCVSDFDPAGDQPEAIERLTAGIENGATRQTLLGVTGSGKTFTMAKVIERMGRPTLILAPNKTLAAQLANEFRYFFPENAVEYFVSYYDYYQPEAYVPQQDLYIEKDASVNEEIDKLRLSATSSLLSRRDTIVVASVSCIYGIGDPEDYLNRVVFLKLGQRIDRDVVLKDLFSIKYERNDIGFERGKFRVRGDILEIYPAYKESAIRVEFFGDEIERIYSVDTVTGEILAKLPSVAIYPATLFVTSDEKLKRALVTIEAELGERLMVLQRENKLVEAQRLEMRTRYDLEMLEEIGYCNGVENYSRHFSGRSPGEPPYTLIDYFPQDLLVFIDESHIAVPQIRGMFNGDRARKQTLVDFGFRLPSALDNRPLKFDEFSEKVSQAIFVSATPGEYERTVSAHIVEQIVRPTGLVDPEVIVKRTEGQIDDLIGEVRERVRVGDRTLITTLTKKMAEDLTEYLADLDLKVAYLHSDVETLDRIKILTELRSGKYDVLVGINLLREGLDLPEVSLVAILDADKEGFLRSEGSLIQTIGRAARNVSGKVIMYADTITGSMERAIKETTRRRDLQVRYNLEHNIEPRSVRKIITDIIELTSADDLKVPSDLKEKDVVSKRAALLKYPKEDLKRLISILEEEMAEEAAVLNYERAAVIRDRIGELRKVLEGSLPK